MEKDGKLLLRTGDPPEIARGALGGGPEQTNLLESDGEARLEVIVNHRGVYSLELTLATYDKTATTASSSPHNIAQSSSARIPYVSGS